MDRDFDPKFIMSGEHLEEISPCGKYHLVVDIYGTKADPAFPSIIVAVIRQVKTSEVIATLKRNDDRLFYFWITQGGHDYLLFSEDLEGQSIVDLTDRRVEGYSSKGGDFIWTEFHPSPSKTKLAIVGCYWACPFQVSVYDFRRPMHLPLPILAQFDTPRDFAKFGEWQSNELLTLEDKYGDVHTFNIPLA